MFGLGLLGAGFGLVFAGSSDAPAVESFVLAPRKIRLSADQIAVGKSCFVKSITCISNTGTTSVVLRDHPTSAAGETVVSTGTMVATDVQTFTDNGGRGKLFLMGCFFDLTGTGTYDLEIDDAV